MVSNEFTKKNYPKRDVDHGNFGDSDFSGDAAAVVATGTETHDVHLLRLVTQRTLVQKHRLRFFKDSCFHGNVLIKHWRYLNDVKVGVKDDEEREEVGRRAHRPHERHVHPVRRQVVETASVHLKNFDKLVDKIISTQIKKKNLTR